MSSLTVRKHSTSGCGGETYATTRDQTACSGTCPGSGGRQNRGSGTRNSNSNVVSIKLKTQGHSSIVHSKEARATETAGAPKEARRYDYAAHKKWESCYGANAGLTEANGHPDAAGKVASAEQEQRSLGKGL